MRKGNLVLPCCLLGIGIAAACNSKGVERATSLPTSPSSFETEFDGDFGDDSSPHSRDGACDDNRFVSTPGNDSAYYHWDSGAHNKRDATDCRTHFNANRIRARRYSDPDGHPRDWPTTPTTPTTIAPCSVQVETSLTDRTSGSLSIQVASRSATCTSDHVTYIVVSFRLNNKWVGCGVTALGSGFPSNVTYPAPGRSSCGASASGWNNPPDDYPYSPGPSDRDLQPCESGGDCSWRWRWSTRSCVGQCFPDWPGKSW